MGVTAISTLGAKTKILNFEKTSSKDLKEQFFGKNINLK